MAIDKTLYTGHAVSTGGRTGTTESTDGALRAQLSTPKELGGEGGMGTNPEQLFAAGYAACFIGAMKAVAGKQKITLPDDVSIAAAVSIGPMTGKSGAFGIAVQMDITVPGMDKDKAEKLVADANEVCPYSNATHGNIQVDLKVV